MATAASRTNVPGNVQFEKQRRLFNPLSQFSSYTYQLSWYMCSPKAKTNFIKSGKFDPKDEVYIVAQSAGVNNAAQKRALTDSGKLGPNETGLDMYIDNLVFDMIFPGGDGTASVSTTINFQVTEPYGFSFFNQLAQASDAINKLPSNGGNKIDLSPMRQHYLLGIRFFGYNDNGDIQNTGSQQNPNYSVFERVFPIIISKVSYKLDGRSTVYNVEAVCLNHQVGFGVQYGQLKTVQNINAGTVGEALTQLAKIMTDFSEQDAKSRGKKTFNKYSVKIDDKIANAKLVDNKTFDSQYTSMSAKIKSAYDATVNVAIDAATNTNSISINLTPQPLLLLMQSIILKSDYIRGVLPAVTTSDPEPNSSPLAAKEPQDLFTINPIVIPADWDDNSKSWTYNIEFEIKKHKTPYNPSPVKPKLPKYEGPDKRYYYWFTGKNTEVISYEATYDNQWYQVRPFVYVNETGGRASSQQQITQNAQAGTQPSVAEATGGGGQAGANSIAGRNKDSEYGVAFFASAFSIADQAVANIKILGDPDFLTSSIAGVKNINATSAGVDTYSIDPLRGTTFIEIVFKTARDYKDDGLLDVGAVQFYRPGTDIQLKQLGVEGVIYKVIKVQHNFSRGLFTQTLECILVPDRDIVKDEFYGAQRSNTNVQVATDSRKSPEEQNIDRSDIVLQRQAALSKELQRQQELLAQTQAAQQERETINRTLLSRIERRTG